MICNTVPQDCLKAINIWAKEQEEIDACKSLDCTTRQATPTDIARIQPKKTLTYDICTEMGIKRKPEKKPEYPYELTLVKESRS